MGKAFVYWLSHPSSNMRMTTFSVSAGVFGANVTVACAVTTDASMITINRIPILCFILCFISPFFAYPHASLCSQAEEGLLGQWSDIRTTVGRLDTWCRRGVIKIYCLTLGNK